MSNDPRIVTMEWALDRLKEDIPLWEGWRTHSVLVRGDVVYTVVKMWNKYRPQDFCDTFMYTVPKKNDDD